MDSEFSWHPKLEQYLRRGLSCPTQAPQRLSYAVKREKQRNLELDVIKSYGVCFNVEEAPSKRRN